MPRESIQITGINVERLGVDGEDGVRITVRTPDNSSFIIYDDAAELPARSGLFLGAQGMLKLKREYQKSITDARVDS